MGLVATFEDVKNSFRDDYTGPAIAILHGDGTDVLIHDTGLTLRDCEKAEKQGATFIFD